MLPFQATLAKKRATCAASEDGTPPGLRSSVSDISFMISDSLRACSGIVTGPPLGLLDRGRGWQQGGFLVTEPPGQRFLQSSQRLGQRVAAVVLEDRTAVVQRTGHETGFLLPPDFDPAAFLNPHGEGWKLPARIGGPGRQHDDGAWPGLPHLPKEIQMYFLQFGEVV